MSDDAPISMTCMCGLPMSRNPHPKAGLAGPSLLEVGYTFVCIPCTVKTSHRWAQRAWNAEGEVRTLRRQATAAGCGDDDCHLPEDHIHVGDDLEDWGPWTPEDLRTVFRAINCAVALLTGSGVAEDYDALTMVLSGVEALEDQGMAWQFKRLGAALPHSLAELEEQTFVPERVLAALTALPMTPWGAALLHADTHGGYLVAGCEGCAPAIQGGGGGE